MLLVVSILPTGNVLCNSADRSRTALAYQLMRADLFANATEIAQSIEDGTSIATIGAIIDRHMPSFEQLGFDGVAVLRCSTSQSVHVPTIIECEDVFTRQDKD